MHREELAFAGRRNEVEVALADGDQIALGQRARNGRGQYLVIDRHEGLGYECQAKPLPRVKASAQRRGSTGASSARS